MYRIFDNITGVNLGLTAVHPFTNQPIPIFAAAYVISDYGTRAVMGVPGHDVRDQLFAEEHHLPITIVDEVLHCGKKVVTNSDKVS